MNCVPALAIRSLLCVVLLAGMAVASEPDPIEIQTLFSWQAPSLQHQVVTVEGVAREVLVLPPATNVRCGAIYGRAVFFLEDETGILPVEVPGSCHQRASNNVPHEGERVRITGIVDIMNRGLPRQVKIHATTIHGVETP